MVLSLIAMFCYCPWRRLFSCHFVVAPLYAPRIFLLCSHIPLVRNGRGLTLNVSMKRAPPFEPFEMGLSEPFFEIHVARLPPSATICPQHAHMTRAPTTNPRLFLLSETKAALYAALFTALSAALSAMLESFQIPKGWKRSRP